MVSLPRRPGRAAGGITGGGWPPSLPGRPGLRVRDTPAATLLAMGCTPEVALGAVRLSLGHGTTATDVSTAATILATAHTLATAP